MPATPARPPRPSPGGMPGLEAAAAAVTAAQRALTRARKELSAAIHEARQSGESVRDIAARTGLDAMTVRNILAIPPAPPRPGSG
ncbi:hypothetical protein [Streptomyces cinereoruber]|uniref:hypothetical protein n=1 Tax=Streptomyces cinereoruber TaxID=67260 RepID=UPI0036333A49